MAEILIQRKRQRSVWPWLLGLAALALLPLPFLRAERGDRATNRPATVGPETTMLGTTPRDTTPSGATGLALGTTPVGDSSVFDRRTTTASGGALGSTLAAPTSASVPAAPGTTATNEPEPRQVTSDGLRRLADELRTLGASGAGVRTIQAYADSVRTTSARQPDHARAAFLAAVRELDVLRGRHAATVDTGRLRTAAWAIRPDQPLVAQRRTVQTFFESAQDATQSVARAKSGRRAR